MTNVLWLVVVVVVSGSVCISAQTQQPNIVFFLVDDLGWNDISWHDAGVITPNLQHLADEGVILNQNYVQPLCTPTRSALLTGYYPYHLGRQNGVLLDLEPTGLTMDKTLLPEKLKELGYDTHMIGKWHLGFCNWTYTPTYRGFDTYYGYYLGQQHYNTHNNNGGFDFRENMRVALEVNGTYSSFLYGNRAVEIIEQQQGRDSPFFLYVAFQHVHTPLRAPPQYEDLYPDETDPERRTLLGMVSAMDDTVGMVVQALSDNGFSNNTLIIFSSDNGGRSPGLNTPLRGAKGSVWEGGTRAPGLVNGAMLTDTPRQHNGLLHVTDWYTTLMAAAGATTLPTNDGFNQWEALRYGLTPSPRDSLIYNLMQEDADQVLGAIRVGRYKYVMGETGNTSELGPWLFDLDEDPNETTNLAGERPDIAAELELLLLAQLVTMVPEDRPEDDTAGDPSNWGNVWTPGWCVAH